MSWIRSSEAPYIIVGPCSVESEEQIDSLVKTMAIDKRVTAIRGGIWKPRTKPNTFEGYGEKALPWLVSSGKKYGLPVCTEVASPIHVEACLKAGVDMFWIGARTTVNPFMVQEIAETLRGVKMPLMVKNPINPDLKLWMGSIERFRAVGIDRIAGIHRGFSFYGDSIYRNTPLWEIPIEFQRLMPDIPILCDPSHITGNRDQILKVSQKAMNLNFDGLMIEVHPDPDNALSDVEQQITPGELKKVLDNLSVRQHQSPDPEFVQKIESYRNSIDEIDKHLLDYLLQRLKISEKIGEYKRDKNVTILKLDRWEKLIEERLLQADKLGLNKEFIEQLLQVLHKESIRIQNEIMDKE